MKKALLVLMCGLLLFGVVALADVHFGHEPGEHEHGMDLRFGDGNELRFGGVASMFWEVKDADANYLAVELPSISATDVPVLVIGVGLDGVDLDFFTGSGGANPQTQPAVVLPDLDRDSYMKFGWSADDIAAWAGKGNCATLGVTFATMTYTASTVIYNYTPAFYVGYDANSWLKIAVEQTTGNVAFTQTGSTKAFSATAAGGFTFTADGGSVNISGDGDLLVDDDLTVTDDIILSGVIPHEWNPGSVQTSSVVSTDVEAEGCALGDLVIVGAPEDVEDLVVSATVTTSGTITIVLANMTDSVVDLQTKSWNVFWFDAVPPG